MPVPLARYPEARVQLAVPYALHKISPRIKRLVTQHIALGSEMESFKWLAISGTFRFDFIGIAEVLEAFERASGGMDAAFKSVVRGHINNWGGRIQNIENNDDTETTAMVLDVCGKWLGPVAQQRNEFAHRIWGHSDALPGFLILVDPLAERVRDARVRAEFGHPVPLSVDPIPRDISPMDAVEIDRAKCEIYTPGCLRELVRQARVARDVAEWTWRLMLPTAGTPWRRDGEAPRLLARLSQVRSELSPPQAPSVRRTPPRRPARPRGADRPA